MLKNCIHLASCDININDNIMLNDDFIGSCNFQYKSFINFNMLLAIVSWRCKDDDVCGASSADEMT